MSPKTPEQFEGIRQEKKALILDTALEVFATHGYHGSSISMIAKHAGIAKGLMYNYFASKEELLKGILQKGVKEILGVFEQMVNKDITPEILKELLKTYFKQLEENATFWRLYFSIAMQPVVLEIFEKEFSEMATTYQGLLVKYYESRGSKHPLADALLAHSIIDGITLNFVMVHHDFDLNLFKNLLIERLVNPYYI